MKPLDVFALVKSCVKTYIIPTNAVPLPLPRNQLAADVQNTLQKADQEPISRQTQIDDLNHEIQSTNQALQTTDANLSGLNQNVIAINDDLQKTNRSLWGENGDDGVIVTLETQNNSQQNSLANHKERIENLESDLTDHVENEVVHITQQERVKWNSGTGGSGLTQNDVNEIVDLHNEAVDAHDDIRTEIYDEVNARTQKTTELSNTIESLSIEMETADTALENRISQAETDINSIQDKIPNQSSNTNQLADKDFTNSSISNMAANYVTPNAAGDEQWANLDALRSGPWYQGGAPYSPSQNDYAIYLDTGGSVWRAAFNGNLWSPTYKVNDSPFTAAQLAALNSQITAALVQKLINPDMFPAQNSDNLVRSGGVFAAIEALKPETLQIINNHDESPYAHGKLAARVDLLEQTVAALADKEVPRFAGASSDSLEPLPLQEVYPIPDQG